MNKRYTYDMFDGFEDNGESLDFSEVEDKLNELDKKFVDEYALRETLELDLQRLEFENEELERKYKELKKQCFVARKQIISISMELVGIKPRLMDLARVLEDVSKD